MDSISFSISDYISAGSLMITGISAVAAVIAYYKNVRHDRRRDTLTAYSALQSEAFDKLNKIKPAEVIEIVKHPRSDEYNEISGYIARIEHFCVGVNQGIYDAKTVYELAHGYLDGNKVRNLIDPIIDRKNYRGDEDYYSNIHEVLEKMEKYHHGSIWKRFLRWLRGV